VDVRVAALYDVHGNVRALEAVLADAGDVDAYVFGGDLVAGAWPRPTLDLALSLGERAYFLRGNWERYLVEPRDHPTLNWLRDQLHGYDVAWPETLELDGALYCHATPRGDEELVLPQWKRSDWSAFTGPLVVCGHTHVQFDFRHDGTRIVNPGSVGNPTVRATAWWAVIDDGEVELRSTDYDTVAASAEMRTSGFPRTDFADELLEPLSVEGILEIMDSAA
jgi:predicted phosphodiesterase